MISDDFTFEDDGDIRPLCVTDGPTIEDFLDYLYWDWAYDFAKSYHTISKGYGNEYGD